MEREGAKGGGKEGEDGRRRVDEGGRGKGEGGRQIPLPLLPFL